MGSGVKFKELAAWHSEKKSNWSLYNEKTRSW